MKYKLSTVTIYEVGPIETPSAVANTNPLYFQIRLNWDSNLVASQVQMHFLYYNAIYFKYNSDKRKCKFNFPRLTVENLYINKTGAIHFCCNNV